MIDFAEQSRAFAAFLESHPKVRGKRCGDRIDGHCPLPEHDDKGPSFSYYITDAGFSCSCGKGKASELQQRLNWTPPSNGNGHKSDRTPAATHLYGKNRKLRYRDGREPKCVWEHFDGGRWLPKADGYPGLYREELLEHDEVGLTESESDADALTNLGIPCLATPYGANRGLTELEAAKFSGKKVAIFEHQDDPGREFSEKAAKLLKAAEAKPLIVRTPVGKDIRDYILTGATKADIDKLINAPPPLKAKTVKEFAADADKPLVFVPTGCEPLDAFVKFVVGCLALLGGYVGSLKTRTLLVIGKGAARNGHAVYLASLELAGTQIARLLPAADRLLENFWIGDTFRTFTELAEDIRAFVVRQTGKPKPLVLLDFTQIIPTDGADYSRDRELTAIAYGLANLAKELDIPIIAACQLGRASVKDGGDPELFHLRESGGLEQAASVVLLGRLDDDVLTLFKAKNRYGPKGDKLVLRVEFEKLELREYTDADRQDDRIKRLVVQIEEIILGEGTPLTRSEVSQRIKIAGAHPKVYEISTAVARSQLVEMDPKGTRVQAVPTPDISGVIHPESKGNGILSFDPDAVQADVTPEQRKAIEDRLEYERQSGIDFGSD